MPGSGMVEQLGLEHWDVGQSGPRQIMPVQLDA
jgi:hypothetical protein